MTRIAVDGAALARPWTGMGTYSRQLLRAMAAQRPESTLQVYVPNPGVTGSVKAHLEERLIPRTRLVGRHLLWPARVDRDHPDAYFGINGHLPLGRLHVPAVITVHDLAIYRNPAWFPGRQPVSTRLIVPRSFAAAAHVIAISRHTARDLEELFHVPKEKVSVVYSGVDPSYRPLEEPDLAAIRAELQLPDRFLLFVGTIEPRKNVDGLIRAWSWLSDRPPLVIAGGYGWKFESTRRLIERFGREIRVLGTVAPDLLPALYNLALGLAHPSWYEGFGLTVLEAMACGAAVVASNRSSLPEVMGEAGVLVDPDDEAALSAALARLVGDEDLRAELGRRGRERARMFTWPATAAGTWSALDVVARG